MKTFIVTYRTRLGNNNRIKKVEAANGLEAINEVIKYHNPTKIVSVKEQNTQQKEIFFS